MISSLDFSNLSVASTHLSIDLIKKMRDDTMATNFDTREDPYLAKPLAQDTNHLSLVEHCNFDPLSASIEKTRKSCFKRTRNITL